MRCETAGNSIEAIAAFRKCVSLRPEFHVAYCNLGNALKDSGQIDEAIQCFRRAVEHLSVRRHLAQQSRLFGLLSSRLRLGGDSRGKPALERPAHRGISTAVPQSA